MQIVDSHCHIDKPNFADDVSGVLTRARAAGVATMLVVGTRRGDADRTLDFARRHEGVWCTVGVHPHYCAEPGELLSEEDLLALAADPKVVGFGETGLDLYRNKAPIDVQRESFRRHVRAAIVADLPVVIHTRDADVETMRLLDEADPDRRLRGVIHCFDGTRALAEHATARGLFISLSGILTYGRSEELRAIARDVPPDRLLVETDAPYLAPEPLRKTVRRNEPAHVVHVLAALAALHGMSAERMAALTTANFHALFDRAAPAAPPRA